MAENSVSHFSRLEALGRERATEVALPLADDSKRAHATRRLCTECHRELRAFSSQRKVHPQCRQIKRKLLAYRRLERKEAVLHGGS